MIPTVSHFFSKIFFYTPSDQCAIGPGGDHRHNKQSIWLTLSIDALMILYKGLYYDTLYLENNKKSELKPLKLSPFLDLTEQLKCFFLFLFDWSNQASAKKNIFLPNFHCAVIIFIWMSIKLKRCHNFTKSKMVYYTRCLKLRYKMVY